MVSDRLPWFFTMIIYFVKISRCCNRGYRAYQRWRCRELRSTLSQIIRLKASDDACLLNQSWSLTKSMEKSLDTCNSRILLIALNILQKQYTTNNELYSDLWKLNEKNQRGLSSKESSIQSCAVGPARKTVNRGRRTEDTISFIDNLMKDADLESVSEIKLQ